MLISILIAIIIILAATVIYLIWQSYDPDVEIDGACRYLKHKCNQYAKSDDEHKFCNSLEPFCKGVIPLASSAINKSTIDQFIAQYGDTLELSDILDAAGRGTGVKPGTGLNGDPMQPYGRAGVGVFPGIDTSSGSSAGIPDATPPTESVGNNA